MLCEELDKENYVEYRTAPSGRWFAAPLCKAWVVDMLTKPMWVYLEKVEKFLVDPPCQTEKQKILLSRPGDGPPVWVAVKRGDDSICGGSKVDGMPIPSGDTHVDRLWFMGSTRLEAGDRGPETTEWGARDEHYIGAKVSNAICEAAANQQLWSMHRKLVGLVEQWSGDELLVAPAECWCHLLGGEGDAAVPPMVAEHTERIHALLCSAAEMMGTEHGATAEPEPEEQKEPEPKPEGGLVVTVDSPFSATAEDDDEDIAGVVLDWFDANRDFGHFCWPGGDTDDIAPGDLLCELIDGFLFLSNADNVPSPCDKHFLLQLFSTACGPTPKLTARHRHGVGRRLMTVTSWKAGRSRRW